MARILIVEHDYHLRTLMAKLLKQANHPTTAVEYGLDALRTLEQRADYDVILFDTDGIYRGDRTFLQDVTEDYPQMPVIVMSRLAALPDAEEELKCLTPFQFLPKPFTKAQLLAVVWDAVGHSAQAAH
jgi:DNA-binding NtrC family response regulator